MSAQDDVELMETLVKGCERFVAKEVASLMKELNAQKEQNKAMEARIGVLEVRNQNLEAEVSKLREESRAGHASCLERLQSALMSATLSLSNDEITQWKTATMKETIHLLVKAATLQEAYMLDDAQQRMADFFDSIDFDSIEDDV